LFAEEAGMGSDDRVAQERELSVLLARALAGDSEATEELLIFEREHGYRPPEPWSAAVVFHARIVRSTLDPDPGRAISLLDGIVWTYDTAISDLSGREDVVRTVATALFAKGVRLDDIGQKDAALAAYNEVLRRFGVRPEASVLEVVASALVNAAYTLGQLGRFDQWERAIAAALALCDARPEVEFAEQSAKALMNRAFFLAVRGRDREAVSIYQDLVGRLEGSRDARLCAIVAQALIAQAEVVARTTGREGERALYQEVTTRFGGRIEPAVASAVMRAQVLEAASLADDGRCADAARIYAEVVSTYGARPEPTALRWRIDSVSPSDVDEEPGEMKLNRLFAIAFGITEMVLLVICAGVTRATLVFRSHALHATGKVVDFAVSHGKDPQGNPTVLLFSPVVEFTVPAGQQRFVGGRPAAGVAIRSASKWRCSTSRASPERRRSRPRWGTGTSPRSSPASWARPSEASVSASGSPSC
jgi:tetratricopeptide (TPR) repeat protein